MASQQISAYSFCYAPPASSEYTASSSADIPGSNKRESILSDLRDTCNSVMARYCCQITLSAAHDAITAVKPHAPLVDTPTDYNLTLTGPLNTVMSARGDLFAHCPLKINITLKIPAKDCPSSASLRKYFEEIEAKTHTTICYVPPPPHRSGLASENRVSIIITGLPDHAEHARVRILVALDEISNLRSDILRIPFKLHNLICGRKRAGLQPIIEETSTNIYFPSPFADLSSIESGMETAAVSDGGPTPLLEEPSPPIYITGEGVNVSRVKEMLNKLAVQKAKSMYHKDASLHARKLDWMLLHRRDELRKIMHDNGSYIAFPPMGSGGSVVTVYAENRVNAERTLRSLNFLACSIYEACFYFNNRDPAIYGADNGAHSFFSSVTNINALVAQLSQVSGAEVTYKSETGCIEVFGTERAVRNVYQRLHEMTFLKMFHQNTVFNVELSNDQREFISGKKSGKINKIMKTTGARIKFIPFSDYNFIIEVESNSFTKALDGLTMLQEELPAEISFYVPELYHKRIIGVGGKNIQRIMKKYGVYVKFSNAEEFASLGGYYDNDDNVVARTPMKNQINLDNLKHAVMDLIVQRDKDFVTQTVSIPFRMHRVLLRDHSSYFAEVTKKTNTRIMWPDHELASDNVTLVGPSTQISQAVQLIQALIPEEYELRVPRTAALTAALVSENFQEAVVKRLDREFNIAVDVQSAPPPPPSISSSSPSPNTTPVVQSGTTTAAPAAQGPGGISNSTPAIASAPTSPSRSTPAQSSITPPSPFLDNDCVIPLKTNKANLENMPPALDILLGYLRSHNVTLYEDVTPKATRTAPAGIATRVKNSSSLVDTFNPFGSSSLVDTFSPFGSKVLPSVSVGGPKLQHNHGFPGYSLFGISVSPCADVNGTSTPSSPSQSQSQPPTSSNSRIYSSNSAFTWAVPTLPIPKPASSISSSYHASSTFPPSSSSLSQSTTPSPFAGAPCGNVLPWSLTKTYVGGDRVVYQGQLWEANWWTFGDVPGGPVGVWKNLGPC